MAGMTDPLRIGYRSIEGGSVDELLDVAFERPFSISFRSKSAAPKKLPRWPEHSALVRGAPLQHDEDDEQYHQPDNPGR